MEENLVGAILYMVAGAINRGAGTRPVSGVSLVLQRCPSLGGNCYEGATTTIVSWLAPNGSFIAVRVAVQRGLGSRFLHGLARISRLCSAEHCCGLEAATRLIYRRFGPSVRLTTRLFCHFVLYVPRRRARVQPTTVVAPSRFDNLAFFYPNVGTRGFMDGNFL